VVENLAGTRINVTERIVRDNPSLTKADVKNKQKELLGANEVAIIPEPPNNTTGHSDGSVMWPMDGKILLLKRDEPMHTAALNELKHSFPNVQIVEMPNYIPNTRTYNFDTAVNCYVNCIMTNNYIYMPSFNNSHDADMMELIKSHTNKTVVSIPSENVADLGGSVRCLSWQVEKSNKTKILQLIKQ
jgi:agmatine/peptidylarginine deiminase